MTAFPRVRVWLHITCGVCFRLTVTKMTVIRIIDGYVMAYRFERFTH